MSLLAFLTGFGGGAAKIAEQEREQVQQDQSAELEYRRKNLEHMVQAAEEGRVNPDLVGRVFEEYMNAMPGLSSRPRGKGVGARFLGKRDLGESSLMRDLGSGAVSLFSQQPGALNIDWNAAQPKTEGAGFNIPTGMPGMPSVPHVQHTAGTPLNQLITNAEQQAMGDPVANNWLYKHPKAVELEQQASALRQLTGTHALNAQGSYMLDLLRYGSPEAVHEAYGNRWDNNPTSPYANTTWMYHPQYGHFQVGIDKGTRRPIVIVGTATLPVGSPAPEGAAPSGQLRTLTGPWGDASTFIQGSPTVASTVPGVGKPVQPVIVNGSIIDKGTGTQRGTLPSTAGEFIEANDPAALYAKNVQSAVDEALKNNMSLAALDLSDPADLAEYDAQRDAQVKRLSMGAYATYQDLLKAQSRPKMPVYTRPDGGQVEANEAEIDQQIREDWNQQQKELQAKNPQHVIQPIPSAVFSDPAIRREAAQDAIRKKIRVPVQRY